MKQYKVTLNFTFSPHGCDVEADVEYDDDGNEVSDALSSEDKAKLEAFRRTDLYFQKHSVEKHVKENSAFGFVECVLCDGELVHAEWDKKKFAIHMVVDTNQTAEELEEELRSNSLEDSEYEACGDTGWIVMTRGPKGESFGPPWDMKDFWEYGLTDYRDNPIQIQLLGEKTAVPMEEELLVMTEKGKEIYKQMSELKQKGIRFTEDDMRKFEIMKILMKDPRHYPLGYSLA